MNKLSLIVSVVVGSLAGALLGVLFAPEKGEKTRKQLSMKGDEYAEAMKSEFEEFVKNMRKKYESALHDTEEIIGKGKSRAEDLKNDVQKVLK